MPNKPLPSNNEPSRTLDSQYSTQGLRQSASAQPLLPQHSTNRRMECSKHASPKGAPTARVQLYNHLNVLEQLDELFNVSFGNTDGMPFLNSSAPRPTAGPGSAQHRRKRARVAEANPVAGSSNAEAAPLGKTGQVPAATTDVPPSMKDLQEENAYVGQTPLSSLAFTATHRHLHALVDLLIKEAALTRKAAQLMLLNAQMAAVLEQAASEQPTSSSDVSISHTLQDAS